MGIAGFLSGQNHGLADGLRRGLDRGLKPWVVNGLLIRLLDGLVTGLLHLGRLGLVLNQGLVDQGLMDQDGARADGPVGYWADPAGQWPGEGPIARPAGRSDPRLSTQQGGRRPAKKMQIGGGADGPGRKRASQ
ncbi:hypothetical protein LIER_43604 [Lithospermum erythrorhizon]|uniref:Uncharacterized protein n=1 Tax=Lithospermum erythrorhizon TaxID=34254 RepID=A0AAV3QEC1_LITER